MFNKRFKDFFVATMFLIAGFVVTTTADCRKHQTGSTRCWVDGTGGYRVEAALKSFDAEQVVLLSPMEAVRVPRQRLSTSDQDFLKAISALQQTAEQGDRLIPHLPQVVGKPVGVLAIIEALRNEFPDGIGANLYGAQFMPR